MTSSINDRLHIILNHYNLSASGFANEIGIQRSSMSHILSGRNKPSLDFVMKVLKRFNDVDIYWLVDGVGTFPSTPTSDNDTTDTVTQSELTSNIETEALNAPNLFDTTQPQVTNSAPKQVDHASNPEQTILSSKKMIDKILILYKDGSFDVYNS